MEALLEALIVLVARFYAAMFSLFFQGWWEAVLRGLERLGRLAGKLRCGVWWLFGIAGAGLSPRDRAVRLAAWAVLAAIVCGLLWR